MATVHTELTVRVTATILRFFDALDERRYDDAAGLMAATGTWHRQGVLLEGPAQVRAALEQRPLDMTTVHAVSSVLVESSLNDAEASFVGTVYSHRGAGSGEPFKPAAMQVSRYSCVLSMENDTWRIKSMTSKIVFRS